MKKRVGAKQILSRFELYQHTYSRIIAKYINEKLITTRNLKRYISKHFYNPKASPRKRLVVQIVSYALLLNSVLLLYLLAPVTRAEGTSLKVFYGSSLGKKIEYLPSKSIEATGETKNFLAVLSSQKFRPTIISPIKKQELTAEGNIVILDNDNISVFEYIDSDVARKEALSYARMYDEGQRNTWRQSTHIYVKDTLVIFYLGNHENIITALSNFAGESLVQAQKIE